jgi:hypothetical protein
MNRERFLTRDNWLGQYYELAMAFRPQGDEQRLLQATIAVWQSPRLVGPWAERSQYLAPPAHIDPQHIAGLNRLYGVLQLTPETEVGCLTFVIREGAVYDWLLLCIPVGMLPLVFAINYPLYSEPNEWMREVDQVFLDIVQATYASAPFHLAVLGEEASLVFSTRDLTPASVPNTDLLLPDHLFEQLGRPEGGIILPSGLHWFPMRNKGLGAPA